MATMEHTVTSPGYGNVLTEIGENGEYYFGWGSGSNHYYQTANVNEPYSPTNLPMQIYADPVSKGNVFNCISREHGGYVYFVTLENGDTAMIRRMDAETQETDSSFGFSYYTIPGTGNGFSKAYFITFRGNTLVFVYGIYDPSLTGDEVYKIAWKACDLPSGTVASGYVVKGYHLCSRAERIGDVVYMFGVSYGTNHFSSGAYAFDLATLTAVEKESGTNFSTETSGPNGSAHIGNKIYVNHPTIYVNPTIRTFVLFEYDVSTGEHSLVRVLPTAMILTYSDGTLLHGISSVSVMNYPNSAFPSVSYSPSGSFSPSGNPTYIGSKAVVSKAVGGKKVVAEYIGSKLVYSAGGGFPKTKGYLLLETEGGTEFTLAPNDTGSTESSPCYPWDGSMEYSTDGTSWQAWGYTDVIQSAGGKIYLRGTGNTYVTGKKNALISGSLGWKFAFADPTDKLRAVGDVSDLLDYASAKQGIEPMMLSNAKNENGAFAHMFMNVANLVQAPTLEARNLYDYCYYSMFEGCASLQEPPNLPSEVMFSSCYRRMFFGCSNLENAPALPSEFLGSYCYMQMFAQCASIEETPRLPAKYVDTSAYYGMFDQCSSLKTIPALPATAIGSYGYASMFYKCPLIKMSLTQEGEYQSEFRIPASGTGSASSSALSSMFADTGGTFAGTPSINAVYYTSNQIIA